jgi:hypothetical protein
LELFRRILPAVLENPPVKVADRSPRFNHQPGQEMTADMYMAQVVFSGAIPIPLWFVVVVAIAVLASIVWLVSQTKGR